MSSKLATFALTCLVTLSCKTVGHSSMVESDSGRMPPLVEKVKSILSTDSLVEAFGSALNSKIYRLAPPNPVPNEVAELVESLIIMRMYTLSTNSYDRPRPTGLNEEDRNFLKKFVRDTENRYIDRYPNEIISMKRMRLIIVPSSDAVTKPKLLGVFMHEEVKFLSDDDDGEYETEEGKYFVPVYPFLKAAALSDYD